MKAKFVKESINFERNSDPKKSLKIGQIANNPFNNNVSSVTFKKWIVDGNVKDGDKVLEGICKILDIPEYKLRIIVRPDDSKYCTIPDEYEYDPKEIIKKEFVLSRNNQTIELHQTRYGYSYVVGTKNNSIWPISIVGFKI